MSTILNQLAARLTRKTSGGNHILEIDGLRFLAIGSVLIYHVMRSLFEAYNRMPLPWEMEVISMAARNPFGVHLFFVISGFILALPFAKYFVEGEKPVNIGRYYLRRLTRLEPPYVIALLLFFSASWFFRNETSGEDDIKMLFIRLFYAHGLVYQHPPMLNGPTWTLEIEVQFYLLVPLLVQVFRLPAVARRTVLALAVLGLPWVPWHGIAASSVLNFLSYFLAGFLLADLYLRFKNSESRVMYDWLAIGLFVFTLVLPIVYCVPLFLFGFVFLMLRGKWLRRVFAFKPIYLIGGMCYSLYLLHYPFMAVFGKMMAKAMPQLGYTPATLIAMLIWLPMVLIIATIFFVLIERPCMDSDWPKKLIAWMKGDVALDLSLKNGTTKTTESEQKQADYVER